MNIGSQFSDNKLYQGISYGSHMPLMSGDLVEQEDSSRSKSNALYGNIFGHGLLNTPNVISSAQGLTLVQDLVALLQGDIIIINSDNQSPLISLSDIQSAGYILGTIGILVWSQQITSQSVMRNYGGVNNNVLPNDLYNEELQLAPSSRYQYRWQPVLSERIDLEDTAQITIDVDERNAGGEPTGNNLTLTSYAKIGNVYVLERPQSLDYVVGEDMYFIPILKYVYNASLSSLEYYPKLGIPKTDTWHEYPRGTVEEITVATPNVEQIITFHGLDPDGSYDLYSESPDGIEPIIVSGSTSGRTKSYNVIAMTANTKFWLCNRVIK